MADVLILVRLKATLVRRSLTGSRGAWMISGAVIGTCLALSTIALSALYSASPAILGDLLGVVYAVWMAGWIVGPVWGGAPLVRAKHFALIPLPRRRLALGLLGATLTGITTAVTLLAFISLVVFGARLGILPALIAVPAVVLQLLLVVLLSRLAVTGFGQVARSRTGAAVIGVLIAGVLVLSQSGWMLAVAVRTSGLLSTGVTPAFAALVRALPSGWGLCEPRGAWDQGRRPLQAQARSTCRIGSRMPGTHRAPHRCPTRHCAVRRAPYRPGRAQVILASHMP